MLQGRFQELYIVIYCIATLFLTKHWHWVHITICGQLTGDMMTSWSNPSLAKVYTPSDALPLQSGFQLKRHFSHLAAWAWDLNCMSTDNRADLTWPASCWTFPAWSHGAGKCRVVTLTSTEENIIFTLHNFFEESLCPRLALTHLQCNALHWKN